MVLMATHMLSTYIDEQTAHDNPHCYPIESSVITAPYAQHDTVT